VESEHKNQLDNLVLMYYLTVIANYPARIIHTSATTIDNIFIDIARLEGYLVIPFSNGLSINQSVSLFSLYPITGVTMRYGNCHTNFI